MYKSVRDGNNIAKNIISGVLLLGGLAVGLLGANIMAAKANESTNVSEQNKARNLTAANSNQRAVSQDVSAIAVPLSDIKTEEDLINLVAENGTQVILDEGEGKLYLAYVNDSNYIEIIEISEEELGSLIQEVSLISAEDDAVEEESVGIPREYWRTTGGNDAVEEESVGIPTEYWRATNTQKQNRKKLNSEEGKKAIEEAKQYKKSQNK